MDTMRNKWLALVVLCLGDLIIVLDTTIVNVALPSIRTSLGFTETGLVWVINAYMLTFGGCLLLGGAFGGHLWIPTIFSLGYRAVYAGVSDVWRGAVSVFFDCRQGTARYCWRGGIGSGIVLDYDPFYRNG